jgi:hypothetical protein
VWWYVNPTTFIADNDDCTFQHYSRTKINVATDLLIIRSKTFFERKKEKKKKKRRILEN